MGVCFVTDRNATGGRSLVDVARSAIEGGVDLIQVREKDLDGADLLALVRAITDLAKSAGGRCRVLVNDRLDVALAARAAGVHLPSEGLPADAVRRAGGKRLLIGRSVHSLAAAREAVKAGPDYLFFGPVFETPSKVAYGPPQGPELLRKVTVAVRAPVWAIGGITTEIAPGLRGIPIAGVAVIRAIGAAADPARAVCELRAALEDSRDPA